MNNKLKPGNLIIKEYGLNVFRNVTKPRTVNTLVYNFKDWMERFYVKIGDKDEYQYRPNKFGKNFGNIPERLRFIVSDSSQEGTEDFCYSLNGLKSIYESYCLLCAKRIIVERRYEQFKFGYECTLNDWRDVDGLGVIMHHETEGVYSVFYTAESPNQARYKALRSEFTMSEYNDIKVRRNKFADLFKLKNVENIIPEYSKLNDDDFRFISRKFIQIDDVRTTSNTMVLYREIQANINESIYLLIVTKLKKLKLVTTIQKNGLDYFALTEYGKTMVRLMLPTKTRYNHFIHNNIQTLITK